MPRKGLGLNRRSILKQMLRKQKHMSIMDWILQAQDRSSNGYLSLCVLIIFWCKSSPCA
jgi:hypothetical protein